MTNAQSTINLILKAIAIGMAVPSIIMLVLDVATVETSLTLLSIGLFTLSVASLSETKSRAAELE
jgi:hypothetical protein